MPPLDYIVFTAWAAQVTRRVSFGYRHPHSRRALCAHRPGALRCAQCWVAPYSVQAVSHTLAVAVLDAVGPRRRQRGGGRASTHLGGQTANLHSGTGHLYFGRVRLRPIADPWLVLLSHRCLQLGLRSITRRKFRVTTDSKHTFPVAPNRLQRNFTVAGPNQAWVSDITYLWTKSGWLYLAIFSIYTLGPLSAGH